MTVNLLSPPTKGTFECEHDVGLTVCDGKVVVHVSEDLADFLLQSPEASEVIKYFCETISSSLHDSMVQASGGRKQ